MEDNLKSFNIFSIDAHFMWLVIADFVSQLSDRLAVFVLFRGDFWFVKFLETSHFSRVLLYESFVLRKWSQSLDGVQQGQGCFDGSLCTVYNSVNLDLY